MIAGRVYTIAPDRPFVDALAAGLMARWGGGGDPSALAAGLVLLPTRRACRALREAFLRLLEGRPLLLPRMVPLGDIDEDQLMLETLGAGVGAGVGAGAAPGVAEVPPAIPELRRRLLLARLIGTWRQRTGASGAGLAADQAARLAAELARLLDQVQTERLGFEGLADLVPEEYARHWQLTLAFLTILTAEWPAVLAEEGAIDPAARRNRLLEAQAEAWSATAPPFPVVAAGSTGSIPATAALLRVVAGLADGCVVLPGLDRTLDEDSWQVLGPTHPQFGMARLLAQLGVGRDAVADWPAPPGTGAPGTARAGAARGARVTLVREVMRPAETTDAWADVAGLDGAALAGVSRIDCANDDEEAGVVALIMRGALEVPGRKAALITLDRALARRVAGALRRWRITVDDSAGVPLADTPSGAFLRLTAVLATAEPVALLAALKHPLAAGGVAVGGFRGRVRQLERVLLRGPRPAPGLAGALAGLRAAAAEGDDRRHGGDPAALIPWAEAMVRLVEPLRVLMARPRVGLGDVMAAHVSCAEALAASDAEAGAERLWAEEAGEAAAEFVNELVTAARGMPSLAPGDYPALLDTLMTGRVVRPWRSAHPRLAILGLLEARLQHFDVVVLGGLNEGVWPPEPRTDPWMSRPMRRDFGLPLQERRIGLSAHDFAQALCADTVVLTRAERNEGTPTVPSRWLQRLDHVVRAAGLPALADGADWRAWQRALDRPDDAAAARRGPPAPTPPVSARPRHLSVTQIEAWMRDPYAIYARHVLRLRPLDDIDAMPDRAVYGALIHDALGRFIAATPAGPLPADALDRLVAVGEAVFAPVLAQPGIWAFWWPRFRRIAAWFVAYEGPRRKRFAASLTEVEGALTIPGPAGTFTVTAVADRIDVVDGGGLVITDYKTGKPPSVKEVAAGFAPQLPLEAAIAGAGGFAGVAGDTVEALLYWRLGGGDPAGEVSPAGPDATALAEQARAGLTALVAAFDDPATGYESRPRPDQAPRFSDYEHLARVKEWSTGLEDPW